MSRTVVRVEVQVEVGFEWRDALHGPALRWHLWVEDGATEQLFHSELWNLTKAMIREGDIKIAFTIPIMEPPPSQLYLRYPPPGPPLTAHVGAREPKRSGLPCLLAWVLSCLLPLMSLSGLVCWSTCASAGELVRQGRFWQRVDYAIINYNNYNSPEFVFEEVSVWGLFWQRVGL